MQVIFSFFLLIAAASCTNGEVACPAIYAPVCGTDGRTYSNDCVMKVNNVELAYKGMCHCAAIYSPVCGTDGQTYSNVCFMKANGVDKAYTGVCVCPAIYSPVCGSDGETYASDCFLKANGVDLAHNGPCNSKDKRDVSECPEMSKHGICTLEYAPVCANDGNTYPTRCFMCAAMYKKRKEGENINLEVVHQGEC